MDFLPIYQVSRELADNQTIVSLHEFVGMFLTPILLSTAMVLFLMAMFILFVSPENDPNIVRSTKCLLTLAANFLIAAFATGMAGLFGILQIILLIIIVMIVAWWQVKQKPASQRTSE